MSDLKETTVDSTASAPETVSTASKSAGNPYRVFFWGGLIMAAMCVYLATTRLAIKRPARADAYFITGIFGVLSAAMAFSLGKASERAQRSQKSLQDSLDRLQDSMQDMPRSLMEESVRVAAREAESRRADQERQARELRVALEQGINAGFAPMAPALAGRIEESLKGLSESLRSDREERAASLKATSDTVASLQSAQTEWAKASSAMLEKLREQGTTLHNDLGARDTASRAAWEHVANASTQGIQSALSGQMEKVTGLVETLSSRWDDTLRAQRETFAGEWREVLSKSQSQLEQAAGALREAITSASASVGSSAASAAASIESASADASTMVQTVAAEADAKLSATSAQAEEWLRNLSTAAGTIGEALESMRRSGDESAVQQAAGQAEWRATVEMFHQGMGGLLDRLQALGSYTQGQAALLERMEEVIRSFEERSAELIEDTALKAQESLLDALDQAGARDAAVEKV
jgi:hypothetical protein